MLPVVVSMGTPGGLALLTLPAKVLEVGAQDRARPRRNRASKIRERGEKQ
jgi:hypothetical protein